MNIKINIPHNRWKTLRVLILCYLYCRNTFIINIYLVLFICYMNFGSVGNKVKTYSRVKHVGNTWPKNFDFTAIFVTPKDRTISIFTPTKEKQMFLQMQFIWKQYRNLLIFYGFKNSFKAGFSLKSCTNPFITCTNINLFVLQTI